MGYDQAQSYQDQSLSCGFLLKCLKNTLFCLLCAKIENRVLQKNTLYVQKSKIGYSEKYPIWNSHVAPPSNNRQNRVNRVKSTMIIDY